MFSFTPNKCLSCFYLNNWTLATLKRDAIPNCCCSFGIILQRLEAPLSTLELKRNGTPTLEIKNCQLSNAFWLYGFSGFFKWYSMYYYMMSIPTYIPKSIQLRKGVINFDIFHVCRNSLYAAWAAAVGTNSYPKFGPNFRVSRSFP